MDLDPELVVTLTPRWINVSMSRMASGGDRSSSLQRISINPIGKPELATSGLISKSG